MAGLKGRAKARSRASGRDEVKKRGGEGFLFHVIALWRATVGESCVKAPIRRRLHGSEPDRGFCTGIAKGLICDFRHAESLERKSPAVGGA